MRVDCPFCGERSLDEFLALGAAGLARPELGASTDAWVDYVYMRSNAAGAHGELFHHVAGCRQWLVVNRDTRTHTISSVNAARPLT
jgi:methylglutamate dehydrogenase subunit B